MMRSYLLNYFVLVALISSSTFAFDVFKVITPNKPDVHDENIMAVVVKVDTNVTDLLSITTDENLTYTLDIIGNKEYYCKNIPIHLGDNEVYIKAYQGDTLLKEYKQNVYYTSKVYKQFKYPPLKFEYNYFHKEKNEKECAKCHDMSVNETKGVAFEDVRKSNCYTCHKPIGYKKHAHAPTVNWLCTSCHNGTVGKYNRYDINKSKYTVADPIGTVCLTCHKKTKKKWAKERFKHEPVDSGRCNKCHNPHGSDEINYLRRPEFDLCTSCHKDKINGSHIIRTYSKKIHPVRGKKDPTRKDRELSCVSCHEPHASNSPSFIRAKTVMGLCSKCHEK